MEESRAQGQAGAGETAVDHVRPVLERLELMLHRAGDLAEAGGGEIADVALDQGPHTLGWVEVGRVGGQLNDGESFGVRVDKLAQRLRQV